MVVYQCGSTIRRVLSQIHPPLGHRPARSPSDETAARNVLCTTCHSAESKSRNFSRQPKGWSMVNGQGLIMVPDGSWWSMMVDNGFQLLYMFMREWLHGSSLHIIPKMVCTSHTSQHRLIWSWLGEQNRKPYRQYVSKKQSLMYANYRFWRFHKFMDWWLVIWPLWTIIDHYWALFTIVPHDH